MHYMRIGKYGIIARMTNPKNQSGPVACSTYPMAVGKAGRKAISDAECVEAIILTHTAWMSDPPGQKTCNFLDIIEDDIGPRGINVNAGKIFDDESQWKYLEDMLENKVDEEIAKRIIFAHKNSRNCSDK